VDPPVYAALAHALANPAEMDEALREETETLRQSAVDADAVLQTAAEQAPGLKVSRPGLTDAERHHRNVMLRNLDDAAGW
jgi:hypothetical protein